MSPYFLLSTMCIVKDLRAEASIPLLINPLFQINMEVVNQLSIVAATNVIQKYY